MQIILLIAILLLLGLLTYQDFKERAISWWLIPVLTILLAIEGIEQLGVKDYFIGVAVNLGLVAFQLLFVTAYFSLKNQSFINIVDTLLGLGDILFFIVLAAALSPINFILGYSISLVIVLLVWVSIKSMLKLENKSIPLAGGMSIILGLFLLISVVNPQINRFENLLLW